MGGALLSGWLARGTAQRVVVVEPAGRIPGPPLAGVEVVTDAAAIPAGFTPDAVVLAVKPQTMPSVIADYARFAGTAVFLSIAAGKPIVWFEERLGPDAAIVRAMPNTPASVGRGMTVAVENARVSRAQHALCNGLLAAVGQVAWTQREPHLDAVTAVSGSGPAYVFLLAEALAHAGEAAGLPADLAAQLARATVAGAGELLQQSHESAEQLRRNVTSPKGTTEAALAVLMASDGLGPLLDRAVAAAAARSRELAG